MTKQEGRDIIYRMAKKKVHCAKPAKRRGSSAAGDFSDMDGFSRMAEGDYSEVQLNYDGEPRPGTLWEAAIEHAERLRSKRQGQSKHPTVGGIISRLGWVRASSKLSLILNPKNRRQGTWIKQSPPFTNQHIERFQREVDECGRAMLLAYANDDLAFFKELARVSRIELGTQRNIGIPNEELIIEKALELWYDCNGNPSRENVKHAVKSAGVAIRSKDWPGYFKRCKLDFLVSYKGAGRPPKPEPIKRFSIEMPKGVFTDYRVTESEGLRLRQEAKYTMRLMAEAEAKGQEYIPF
jgi:hypothetical protein